MPKKPKVDPVYKEKTEERLQRPDVHDSRFTQKVIPNKKNRPPRKSTKHKKDYSHEI